MIRIIHTRPAVAWLSLAGLMAFSPSAPADNLYDLHTISVHGRSGRPERSTLNIARTGYLGAMCAAAGGPGSRRIIFTLDVPSGHELIEIRAWGKDESTSNDLELSVVEVCQPYLTAGAPTRHTIASISSNTSAGWFWKDLPLGAHVATSNTCGYVLEAHFAQFGQDCDPSGLALTRVLLTTNNPAALIFRDHFE